MESVSETASFSSAGEYFASKRADSWRCGRCAATASSTLDGKPPASCLLEVGGCGRSRDDDEAYTYFVPADWSDAKVQLAVDAFVQPGQRLFNEIVSNLQRHFYLKEPWQYRILALYVLQCKVATGLPSVFYIGLGGTKGSGKTTLQVHLVRLARGHAYSNVSIPTFARKMKHGDNVSIDEIDESRGKEYDSIRDALLRDGYRAEGPKYERWDYKKNCAEIFSVFGPKVFGYRQGLEDALRSRSFPIPTVKPIGASGAEYVNANLWPEDDGLPTRLDEWAVSALKAHSPETLKALVQEESFQGRLKRAVPEIGANRETELSTIGLLVAEMAGVDVTDDLRAANEAATSLGDPEPLEQLRLAVRALIRDAREKGNVGIDGSVRLLQRVVRDNVNNLRLLQKQRTLSDGEFAKWRRDLGVDDNLLKHPKNKTTWIIPKSLADAILLSGDEDPEANRLTPEANP